MNILFIFILFSLVQAENDSTIVIENDPWIAKDKFLHFSFSASLVLTTQYFLVEKLDYKSNEAIYSSVLVSVGSGISKEIYDSRKPNGFFSKRDMIANFAGIIFGIYIINL